MTIEQIKKKTQYGDYTLLGQVLGLNSPAAKMRFLRGDENAKQALLKIIASREELIKEFREPDTDDLLTKINSQKKNDSANKPMQNSKSTSYTSIT